MMNPFKRKAAMHFRRQTLARGEMLKLIRTLAVVAVFISMLATNVAAQSGAEDFRHYCAACHGPDGKGKGTWNGTEVPDLTRLSQQNGGKFPFEEIHKVVDGRSKSRWHQRVRDMPYWGEVFEAEANNPTSKAQVQARIAAIVDYIRGIQEK
jgi:mono/diheme cytochrome c family protein